MLIPELLRDDEGLIDVRVKEPLFGVQLFITMWAPGEDVREPF